MTPLKYETLKAGDLVFTTGSSLVARVIQRITSGSNHGYPSHIGIVIDFYGQKLIAEMLNDGLVVSSLESYRKSKRKTIHSIWRLGRMTDDKIERLQQRIALDRRKQIEYDWRGVMGFITGKTDCPEKFYCSEYVVYVLRYVGAYPTISRSMFSPNDIFNDIKSLKDSIEVVYE